MDYQKLRRYIVLVLSCISAAWMLFVVVGRIISGYYFMNVDKCLWSIASSVFLAVFAYKHLNVQKKKQSDNRLLAFAFICFSVAVFCALNYEISYDILLFWWKLDFDKIVGRLLQIAAIVIVVLCAFAANDAIKGVIRKRFIISAVAILLVSFIVPLCVLDIDYKTFYLATIIENLELLSLGAALIVLSFQKSESDEYPKNVVEEDISEMPPEKALKRIAAQLELGMITEGQYAKMRKDIIEKL